MQILDLASRMGDEQHFPSGILSIFLLSISVPLPTPNGQIEQEALWHFWGVRSLQLLLVLQIKGKFYTKYSTFILASVFAPC